MVDTPHNKEKMAKLYHHIIVLIAAAVFSAACATALTPTLPPAAVPPTPTVAPTAVPPTPTARPAALPSPHPTDGGTPMPTSQPATSETPVRVIIGDTVLTGRLWDNATARDLIAQLPLTLTFRDFNSVEKIAQLPRKLSMDGVPAGDDPFPRDIGYYNPSGHLVFYYDDVGYFTGIVRLGQFDGNMDAISSQTGDFTARIELAE
jgi:hypothetical protein